MKQTQTREMILTQVNEDRTVELSFMSEEPVPREYNGRVLNEILMTTNETVNIDRLVNNGPVLFNHDFDEPIGVVEKAWIDDNERKGRAIVRFGSVGKAAEIYDLIREKILSKVSIGYSVLNSEVSGNNLICTDINIHELSIVSVPADDTVGIGRGINTTNILTKGMEMEENQEMEQERSEEMESVTEERAENDPDHDGDNDESAEGDFDHDREMDDEVTADDEVRALEAELKQIRKSKVIEAKKRELTEQIKNERAIEIKAIAEAFNVEIPQEDISVEEFKRSITDKKSKVNIKEEIQMEKNQSYENAVRGLKGLSVEEMPMVETTLGRRMSRSSTEGTTNHQ
ncbi:HK97 family phage prohead protease [Klebsiella aerogenes]|uniref:HK97 family phage prohead protease n=1 Tax=Klebsiella aerogenes TaxID=548 RepID=UPI002A7FE3DD|nr:HK97 family phage prohead protease [Klebsiella aerogenes]WPS10217.1 HK97 family phage prohead protease [Klebsiella aerogenes]